MELKEIANRLAALVAEMKFGQAIDELYHEDIVSVEEDGEDRELQGLEAVKGKAAWWDATYEVLSCTVEGPWLNEPCFLIKLTIETKNRETSERTRMGEFCLYSVHEGKVKHERFFGSEYTPLGS